MERATNGQGGPLDDATVHARADDRDHAVMPDDLDGPRWIIVVRRDKPGLYEHMRQSYEGDARVEVLLDRRRGTAIEIPVEADVRRADRRMGDRRSGAGGDRRQAQRRQPLPASQHDFWATEGFFMVARAGDLPGD